MSKKRAAVALFGMRTAGASFLLLTLEPTRHCCNKLEQGVELSSSSNLSAY